MNKLNNIRKINFTTLVNLKPHVPVLAEQAVEFLDLKSNKTILDMTFGAGGHSRLILEKCSNIKIIALDRDPIAYKYACELSKEFPNQITPLLGRFSEIPLLFQTYNIPLKSIDGILFDFGCSSMQFDEADRGFSLSKNGPLDMRMDQDRYQNKQPTVSEILSNIDENDLAKILKVYGEEKYAKKIARNIILSRYTHGPIKTTQELANIVKSTFNNDHRLDQLQRHSHSATKTFQALRIFVNNELNEINYGLVLAESLLKLNGILVAISFHSLEDTIVKRFIMGNMIENTANPMSLKDVSHNKIYDPVFIESLMESNWKQINKHVITPNLEEIERNPRSRSAKLRAAIKIK